MLLERWKANVGKECTFSPLVWAEFLTGKPGGFLYLALSPGSTHGSGCLGHCLSQQICKNPLHLGTFRKKLSQSLLSRILKGCNWVLSWIFSKYSESVSACVLRSLLKSPRDPPSWLNETFPTHPSIGSYVGGLVFQELKCPGTLH